MKDEKSLKVKCGVSFIDRLKVIEYAMRFFLLFIYNLLFYPSSYLEIWNLVFRPNLRPNFLICYLLIWSLIPWYNLLSSYSTFGPFGPVRIWPPYISEISSRAFNKLYKVLLWPPLMITSKLMWYPNVKLCYV